MGHYCSEMNSNTVVEYRIFDKLLANFILIDNEITDAVYIDRFSFITITYESGNKLKYVYIAYKNNKHKYAMIRSRSINWNDIAWKYRVKILLMIQTNKNVRKEENQ